MRFLIDGNAASTGASFRATVMLIDHVGGRHSIGVVPH